MRHKLKYIFFFSVGLSSCNSQTTKNTTFQDSAVITRSPVEKITTLTENDIWVDLQVGFENEEVKIYIDDSLILNRIINTQEGIALAYRLHINRYDGKIIKLNCISTKISDSFKIQSLSQFLGVRIDKKNKRVVFINAKTPFLYN